MTLFNTKHFYPVCLSETISVDQTVAQAFKLRAYQDVIINIVDPKVILPLSIHLPMRKAFFYYVLPRVTVHHIPLLPYGVCL